MGSVIDDDAVMAVMDDELVVVVMNREVMGIGAMGWNGTDVEVRKWK